MGNSQFLESDLIKDERYGSVYKLTYQESLIVSKVVDLPTNQELYAKC